MPVFPLVKYLILFAAGIIFSRYHQLPGIVLLILVPLLFFIIILFKNRQHIITVAVLLLIFASGCLIAGLNKNTCYTFNEELASIKPIIISGTIQQIELKKQNEIRFYIDADSINSRPLRVNAGRPLFLCRIITADSGALYSRLLPGFYINISGKLTTGNSSVNPGAFVYKEYLNENGVSGIISAYSASSISITKQETDYLKSRLFLLRRHIETVIFSLHNAETASLLKGLILGERGELDYETKNNFINAGVMHILAVSGLNTALIILLLAFITGRLNMYMRGIITIAGLFCFMFISGSSPSVVRAVIMSSVLIISYLSNRTVNIYNSLGLSAFIMLIIKPAQLFDAGFQLSFAAVAAIAFFYPLNRRLLEKFTLRRPVYLFLMFLLMTITVQIGTLPFILFYFKKLSLISPAANIAAVPLSGFILKAGLITLVVYFIIPGPAVYYAMVNDVCSKYFFAIVNYTGSVSYSYLPAGEFTILDSLLFYFFLFLIVYILLNVKRALLKMILTCAAAAVFFQLITLDNRQFTAEGELNIIMFDIGQGDAILLKLPDGSTALVDAGRSDPFFDSGERVLKQALEYISIPKINYGIISHVDIDHYGGFISLIQAGLVERVLKPQCDTASVRDKKLEKYLNSRGIPVNHYSPGIFDLSGVRVYCFNRVMGRSSNDRSGILKIQYGSNSAIFLGDAGAAIQDYYAGVYKEALHADIIKISHHGSKNNISEKLLDAVKPEYALISCGRHNSYGHPAPEVIDLLKARGIKILRTDQDGCIILRCTGKDIYRYDWKN